MVGGMLDAVKGCLKELVRMDAISNNLANADAIGFKKDRVSFQDLLHDLRPVGSRPRTGESPYRRTDSALIHVRTDFDQGNIRSTGNTLDFAIHGNGFFKIDTTDGIEYTRKGNFQLDSEGFLVTQAGNKVLGKGGPIQIDGDEIRVDEEGAISVDGSEVGRFDIVDLTDYEKVSKRGMVRFEKGYGNEETPASESEVRQGYVELSNVNVTQEMVQMIDCLRAFETYQKSIQVLDGVNKKVINEVSRVR
jgi:flagellar basal-body rod protein FlgG